MPDALVENVQPVNAFCVPMLSNVKSVSIFCVVLVNPEPAPIKALHFPRFGNAMPVSEFGVARHAVQVSAKVGPTDGPRRLFGVHC